MKICTLQDTFSPLKHSHLQPNPESDNKYIHEMKDTILWNLSNIFTSSQSHETTGTGIEWRGHRGTSNYRNTCKAIWNSKPYEPARENFLRIIPQNVPGCHVQVTKNCMSRSKQKNLHIIINNVNARKHGNLNIELPKEIGSNQTFLIYKSHSRNRVRNLTNKIRRITTHQRKIQKERNKKLKS